jgi:hypothetical protein
MQLHTTPTFRLLLLLLLPLNTFCFGFSARNF